MDILLIILLPIIVTLIFGYIINNSNNGFSNRYYNRRVFKFKHYIITIITPIIIGILMYIGFINYNMDDIEYLGSYVTHIIHYDEWDEWVHRTCSRRVPSGRDSNGNTIYRTEYYDCSYRDYHPEKWVMYDNMNKSYNISVNQFNEIKNIFNSEMIFVDMKRNYYRIDGDAQRYNYNGEKERIYGLTNSSHYKNKTKTKYTLFKYDTLETKDIKNLYEYPEIKSHTQNPILGIKNLTRKDYISLIYLNSMYGKPKQIRIYLLGYYNQPIEISEQQKIYWEGGNKNELVICLGLDSLNNIKWNNTFSWCDAPELEIKIKSHLNENEKLNIPELCNFIENNLNSWKRKEFKDFDYIMVDLSLAQLIAILIIIIIATIIMFFISKEYIF